MTPSNIRANRKLLDYCTISLIFVIILTASFAQIDAILQR